MKKGEIVVLIGVVVIAGVLVVGIISLLTPTSLKRIILSFTPTPSYYPDLSVSMHNTLGWAQGGYELEIYGNGNVSYDEAHAAGGGYFTHDKRSGKLSPQQIEELAAAIKKASGWATWAVKHPFLGGILCYGCPADLTVNGQKSEHLLLGGILCMDCSKIDLSFTLNGQTEHISHSMLNWGCDIQGSPPRELCDLENQIAGIRYLDVYATPTPAPSTPTR